ncbi:MAG: MarR family transcriptional regulator [Thermoleophilia bacterium]|nr:MarR family transcriptional regulator [Thermoleophilia bacterium]MDH3680759.1 MarR family transcriptional regulator [Acidimicrobiia bacterium]
MTLSFDPIEEARRNWRRHGWGGVDAMSAATSITRAHQIVLGRINEALTAVDLNFSRFEALALLSFTRTGELPLGKMGDRLQVHPASITNTIDRLERDGLVERVRHPTDRRTTLARITGSGRRAAERGAAVLADIEFGIAGLPPAARRRIDADIADLRRRAGDF